MRSIVHILLSMALILLTVSASSFADYARGPAPTDSALEANLGPFDYGRYSVSRWSVSGFRGGTMFYPDNTSEGPFAGIVICPGYYESAGDVDWWGPRLASNGFIVFAINVNNTYYDQPPARASQMMSALGEIIERNSSSGDPLYGLVDKNRLGLMGHSMGGGGTLIAAQSNAGNPAIKAIMPLAPWDVYVTNFSGINAATLIVACQSDSIAPVSSHARPFYNSLNSSIDKMFVEFRGDDHFCVIDGNSHYALLGKLGICWMKVFLDEDARYLPFLNDINYGSDYEISTFLSNRPYSVDGTIPGDDDDDDAGDNAIISGTYSMIASHSGKALDTWEWGTTDGTNIAQYNYWGAEVQQFIVTPVDDIWHRISPVIAPDQAMDVSGCVADAGANIQTWTYSGGACQQFRFENAGNGQYRIIARHSEMCLDVYGRSQEDGANVIQWDCLDGAANQMFTLEPH